MRNFTLSLLAVAMLMGSSLAGSSQACVLEIDPAESNALRGYDSSGGGLIVLPEGEMFSARGGDELGNA